MESDFAKEGPKSFERGEIPKEDRKWIRPIMNAGLIMTQPAEAHLGDAEGLALTPLGKLLVSSAVQGIKLSTRS